MKITNFSKTFKNGVFRDFGFFRNKPPPLVSLLSKTRGGLLREMTLMSAATDG